MEIRRVDGYSDPRFSQKVLLQHGCFLIDGEPYEVEIISESDAIVRGRDRSKYPGLIDEFRFFTLQITVFTDADGRLLRSDPPVELLTIPLDRIQPSQFYVDRDKIRAVSTFLSCSDDIIIQVLPDGDRFISLDGHTRLYYAVEQGWETVRAVVSESDDWVYAFVREAMARNVYAPKDMILLPHEQYTEKWDRFCDAFFSAASDST